MRPASQQFGVKCKHDIAVMNRVCYMGDPRRLASFRGIERLILDHDPVRITPIGITNTISPNVDTVRPIEPRDDGEACSHEALNGGIL